MTFCLSFKLTWTLKRGKRKYNVLQVSDLDLDRHSVCFKSSQSLIVFNGFAVVAALTQCSFPSIASFRLNFISFETIYLLSLTCLVIYKVSYLQDQTFCDMESEKKSHKNFTIKEKIIAVCRLLFWSSVLVILCLIVFISSMYCSNEFIQVMLVASLVVCFTTMGILAFIDEDFQGGGGNYY